MANKRPSRSPLTHLDDAGHARVVDVGAKPVTHRVAIAESRVKLGAAARRELTSGQAKKGDVLAAARIAGIQAAKQTSNLIPLCHPIALTHVAVDIEAKGWGVLIRTRAETEGKTGVEMEAMTAASVAALTIYDMLKAVERGITIEQTRLIEKSGGRSGRWKRR